MCIGDVAVLFVIVGVALFGDAVDEKYLETTAIYSLTAYVVGSACGLVAAILVLLAGCK